MKKLTNYLLSGAMSLLIAQPIFADNDHKTDVIDQCSKIFMELGSLAIQNPRDACSGDIKIASAYLYAANIKLQHNKYDAALISLKKTKHDLYDISFIKPYCSYFTPFTKRYLAHLIQIISQIEFLEQVTLKH